MEITKVGVRLVTKASDRLKAFCTLTIDDCFVVRDLKVVDGPSGLFVAMPSRKRTVRCPSCGHKNEIRARYCNDCAAELPVDRGDRPHGGGKSSSHTDVAHPVNTECREMIQKRVLEAYDDEVRQQQEAVEAERAEEARKAEEACKAEEAEKAEKALIEAESEKAKEAQPETIHHKASVKSPICPPDDSEGFGAGIL